jgi:hypothetical protein
MAWLLEDSLIGQWFATADGIGPGRPHCRGRTRTNLNSTSACWPGRTGVGESLVNAALGCKPRAYMVSDGTWRRSGLSARDMLCRQLVGKNPVQSRAQ